MKVVDLYCGASGAGTGIEKSLEEKNIKDYTFVSVNHWDKAIEYTKKNHPHHHVYEENLFIFDPNKVKEVFNNSDEIDLLWMSPSCVKHSKARGVKGEITSKSAVDNQLRSHAWVIKKWLDVYKIKRIMIENVGEFTKWSEFNDFEKYLNDKGYYTQWKILTCSDYGDHTKRERFFMVASLEDDIRFPDKVEGDFSAKHIIDFDNKGQSLCERKKPLSKNTMRRIEHGLRRFKGEPYLVVMKGTSNSASINEPLPTMTTTPHLYLAQPFFIQYNGTSMSQPIDKPLGTLTTKDRFGLVQPENGKIYYRMLTPQECSKAHSFPIDYKFPEQKTVTMKMIGNSVPVNTVKALVGANI